MNRITSAAVTVMAVVGAAASVAATVLVAGREVAIHQDRKARAERAQRYTPSTTRHRP